MKERTEQDFFGMKPIIVTFGNETYPIYPLPRKKANAWREKLVETMKTIVDPMSAEQSVANMGPAMTAALVAFPDKVAELVYAYAPELPQEKIDEEATEEQFAVAYSGIMVMAYPFLAPLILTMKVTKSRLN